MSGVWGGWGRRNWCIQEFFFLTAFYLVGNILQREKGGRGGRAGGGGRRGGRSTCARVEGFPRWPMRGVTSLRWCADGQP